MEEFDTLGVWLGGERLQIVALLGSSEHSCCILRRTHSSRV